VRRVSIALALPVVLFASEARAVDPFEIQVYDGTANAEGEAGIEVHLNRVADGDHVGAAPELPTHHQTHMTLEPSYGITRTWELGGYFQTALRSDGTFDYAGVKLRSKHVMPPDWHPHLRLGVNFELSLLPETYDRDRWGAEIRPIVAWDSERWFFALNPIVGVPLAGDGFSQGPTFEPAAKVMHQLPKQLGFGFEYYADIGPIASPLALRDQRHYVYEVIDVLAIDRFELNAGVGEGLTPASNGVVFKIIVGYGWDLTSSRPPLSHR
jgi:hypothetical protein